MMEISASRRIRDVAVLRYRSVLSAFCRTASVALITMLVVGCATPALHSARRNFYRGNLVKADESLQDVTIPEKDRVLYLMERGTILQAQGRYEDSSTFYIKASGELDQLETYSVSKGSASLVVNDGVQDFKGTPFERTLLHAFTANNHLARGDWDNAAVEARRIIRSLQPRVKGDYPEDAYSRYMAGFCLEMIDDYSNAALQYRLANALLDMSEINEENGHLRAKSAPEPSTNAAPENAGEAQDTNAGKDPAIPDPWPREKWPHELVTFVLLGRAPGGQMPYDANWKPGASPHVEIHHKGKLLGRSYPLADTAKLTYATVKKQAVRKAVKTGARVAIKEAAAQAVESENEALGELVRFILIGLLEQPDLRHWETLPHWLQVARVPCPAELDEYDVIVKNAAGRTTQTMRVTAPITQRHNLFVSFCRDLPIPSTLPPGSEQTNAPD